MALQIIEPNQPIPVGAINVLVYGQPGTGKSSLGYTTRRPLVLDFDNGAHRSRQSSLGRTVRIDSWADIAELMKSGIIDSHDTIVIDTVGRALDYISAWLVSTNPKLGTSRGLSMQGWGELKAVFTQWLKAINVLGKDVVMVAHGKEEKEGDNIRKRPDVAGGSYAEVMKVADFIGYVHMAEGKRAIGFAPTDDWIGKDSAGLGKVYVPDFSETPTYGGDLLASMRRAFGELTQSQREAVETVTTWRDTIEGIDDAEGINNAIPSIVALDEPMRSQVKTVLNKRAKALGLTWDKAANAYVWQEVAA